MAEARLLVNLPAVSHAAKRNSRRKERGKEKLLKITLRT